jgi:hypothetical protein
MSKPANVQEVKIFDNDKVKHGPNIHVYEIWHEPVGYNNKPPRRLWSQQNDAKIALELSLHQQHGDKPKFKGPIEWTLDFYMPPIQTSQATSSTFDGSWHKSTPTIEHLVAFVRNAANQILFTNCCIISVLNARKHFSKHPRTVLTVRELK